MSLLCPRDKWGEASEYIAIAVEDDPVYDEYYGKVCPLALGWGGMDVHAGPGTHATAHLQLLMCFELQLSPAGPDEPEAPPMKLVFVRYLAQLAG